MASTANLRLRRSAAQLHALAEVEREIRAQDSHSRRKYLREFSQSFREYDCVLDPQGLDQAIRRADIVLLGDYHALPAPQRYAAAAVEQRALAGDPPVVLRAHTIFARHPHILPGPGRSRLHAAGRASKNWTARLPRQRKNSGDAETPSECGDLCVVRGVASCPGSFASIAA